MIFTFDSMLIRANMNLPASCCAIGGCDTTALKRSVEVTLMELFYNPERMSETEIKETFVAYQWLVDEIISILKRQPKGAGVQHVVIVAPRGMGKTTMLLMLRFTVLSQDIAKRWQPVLFPEESYGVYDLA